MLHLILVGILYILRLSVKNRGCGEGVGILLHGQNLLSVTKVICRQSLTNLRRMEALTLQHEEGIW